MISPTSARDHLQKLFSAAVAAVNPRSLISRVVRIERGDLLIQPSGANLLHYHFSLNRRILLIGAGKGAGFLVQELEQLLEEYEITGVVVVPAGQNPDLRRVTIAHGEHPLPGAGSRRSTSNVRTPFPETPR